MIEQLCLVILSHIAQREAPVDAMHMHPETWRSASRGRIVLSSGHEFAGVAVVFDPKLPVGAVQAVSHRAPEARDA